MDRQMKLPSPEAEEAKEEKPSPRPQEVGTCSARRRKGSFGVLKALEIVAHILHRREVSVSTLVDDPPITKDDEPWL